MLMKTKKKKFEKIWNLKIFKKKKKKKNWFGDMADK